MSKDYIAYSKSQGLEQYQLTFSLFFLEPYRYILHELLSFISNDQDKIVLMSYYVNLILNCIFFIWIAKLDDVSIWKKTLFFSIYFIVFTFVWLRASIAYGLISYFLYHGFRNKNQIVGFLSPLVHLSSLPIIYLWLLKYVRVYLRPILVIFLLIISLFFISSEYSSYLTGKVDTYIETGSEKENIQHQIYFIIINLLLISFIYKNKKYLNDYFIVSLYLLYFATHFINVVAAQRISHYLIIAILFFPENKIKRPIIPKKLIKIIAISFIIIFYFKFSTVINFEA